jgi:HK97 family phage major capsid protein/HK97 family phage prohead protease
MNRAYTLLTIKAVDDDQRVIEGIASTPSPDRMGDIVEPMGAKFKLPMPLLWQHDARSPVGHVEFAKPNKDGIPFKARVFATDTAGKVKERLDEAWESVKLGLVRAVSIGFTINAYEILKEGGWRINEWEWLELSLVTIPANADATIDRIKSIDAELLAASGHKQGGERTVKAGVTASRKPVKAMEAKTMTKKTIAEQISAFEATRQAKAARMSEIMDAAAEKGETLDQAGQQEYDTLNGELKSIDDHLVRLRDMEKINVTKAVPAAGGDGAAAAQSRAGSEPIRVQVRGGNVPKGIGFIRLVGAKTAAYLSKGQFTPLEFVRARPHWQSETPEVEAVLKAAVSPGTTTDSTWASPLVEYQMLASEFVDYLHPKTIIGRINGLRRVPFKVKFPRQTGTATAGWVGEAKPKPATSLAFDSLTLDPTKVAGIIPISMELMRLSSPSAEMIVRDELAAAIVELTDNDFTDPEKSASAGVSPASITNGVTGVAATGTAYSNLKADVKSVMDNYFAANITPDTVLMRQSMALSLSLMETSLGNPQFPGLTMNGGTFLGMNAITSENIDHTEDSPQEGALIIFLRAQDIALADDGQAEIDVSTEASIEMSTTPTDPVTASTVLVSLWQHNLVGIRAERMINWVKRRSAAVQYIKAAKYA